MSQNSNTLHLQFSSPVPMRQFQLWLEAHAREDAEGEARWAQELGLPSDLLRQADWLNVEGEVEGGLLVASFDTSTHQMPPWSVLKVLAERVGLLGAVLETFHSQVGETSAELVRGAHRVGPAELRESVPTLAPVVERLVRDADEGLLHLEAPGAPEALADLIADTERRQAETAEFVEALLKQTPGEMAAALKATLAASKEDAQADEDGGGNLLVPIVLAVAVGVALLVFTDLAWWGTLLLVIWAWSLRNVLTTMGLAAWHPREWSYLVPTLLTAPVLVGASLPGSLEQGDTLQLSFAGAAVLVLLGALYLLGDALFGALDEEAGEEPTPRWAHVMGMVLANGPMLVAAVIGPVMAWALPAVQRLFG